MSPARLWEARALPAPSKTKRSNPQKKRSKASGNWDLRLMYLYNADIKVDVSRRECRKKIHAIRRQKYAANGESVENLRPTERNLTQNHIHMRISQNQTVFLLPGFEKGYSQCSEGAPFKGTCSFVNIFCEMLGKHPGYEVFAPPILHRV